MRASLPATLLLSALLAACASTKDTPVNRDISQSGALKAHPGLLGQPVPKELQQDAALTAGPGRPGNDGGAATTLKPDQLGQPSQRSVYFDFDSNAIKTDFGSVLKAHARYLADNPTARVRIDGHADERGTADYNRQLGMQRAENVRQSMIAAGAPEQQIRVKTLGNAHPKQKGHDEKSWSENRRADIVYE